MQEKRRSNAEDRDKPLLIWHTQQQGYLQQLLSSVRLAALNSGCICPVLQLLHRIKHCSDSPTPHAVQARADMCPHAAALFEQMLYYHNEASMTVTWLLGLLLSSVARA